MLQDFRVFQHEHPLLRIHGGAPKRPSSIKAWNLWANQPWEAPKSHPFLQGFVGCRCQALKVHPPQNMMNWWVDVPFFDIFCTDTKKVPGMFPSSGNVRIRRFLSVTAPAEVYRYEPWTSSAPICEQRILVFRYPVCRFQLKHLFNPV